MDGASLNPHRGASCSTTAANNHNQLQSQNKLHFPKKPPTTALKLVTAREMGCAQASLASLQPHLGYHTGQGVGHGSRALVMSQLLVFFLMSSKIDFFP